MIDPTAFRSTEEKQFWEFLKLLIEYKIVTDVSYEAQSFLLCPAVSEPVDNKKKSLLRQHSYTPDFIFEVTDNTFKNLFSSHDLIFHGKDGRLSKTSGKCYVDIKGTFNRFKSDSTFSLNQKWMWSSRNIFVNKLIPKLFFRKINLAPDSVRWHKNRKHKICIKALKGVDSLDDLLKFTFKPHTPRS